MKKSFITSEPESVVQSFVCFAYSKNDSQDTAFNSPKSSHKILINKKLSCADPGIFARGGGGGGGGPGQSDKKKL